MLLLVAYRMRLPYPILLVVGGAGVGFIPGLPDVELSPDAVLVIFLPPLLYAAAFFSSLRDLRDNVRPIGLLAIGLVVCTTLGVGVVAHAVVDDLSWAAAFTLGAIVAPTDPVAATAIASRLGRAAAARHDPRGRVAGQRRHRAGRLQGRRRRGGDRLVLADGRGRAFVLDRGGRASRSAIAVGVVVAEVRRVIDDAPTEITISLLTPVLRLPARRGARRQRGARRGDERHLPRLARAGADHAATRIQLSRSGRCSSSSSTRRCSCWSACSCPGSSSASPTTTRPASSPAGRRSSPPP